MDVSESIIYLLLAFLLCAYPAYTMKRDMHPKRAMPIIILIMIASLLVVWLGI